MSSNTTPVQPTDDTKADTVLPTLPIMAGRTSQFEATIREEWFPKAEAVASVLRDELDSLTETVAQLRADLAKTPSWTEHDRLTVAEVNLRKELKDEQELVNVLIRLGQYAGTVISPIAKRLGVEPTSVLLNRRLLRLSFTVGDFEFQVVRDQLAANDGDGTVTMRPAYKVMMTDTKGVLNLQSFVLDDAGWTLDGLNRFDGMLVARRRGRDASKRDMPANAYRELFAPPNRNGIIEGKMPHASLLGRSAITRMRENRSGLLNIEGIDRYSPE